MDIVSSRHSAGHNPNKGDCTMTTKTEGKEKTAPEIHDLFSREIRPIRNWHEFLERWQVAVTLEEMLGLLHAGFNVSSFDQEQHDIWGFQSVDRLTFYFKIADGWVSSMLLRVSADYRIVNYGIQKTSAELRQILARKAFEMLCQHFFRPEEMDGSCRGNRFVKLHFFLINYRVLFPAIQHFFRPEEGLYCGRRIVIRNLSDRRERLHFEKQAIIFLLDLAVFLFGWREQRIENWVNPEEVSAQNTEIRTWVDSAKLWMIEVLAFLDRLDILNPEILNLDEDCLAKLLEIALRARLDRFYDCYSKKDRLVKNLDEACLADSSAALFLMRQGVVKREHDRLRVIRQAEEELASAQAEIARLKG